MTYLVASVTYACAGLTILGVPLLPAAAHPALAAVGLCRAVAHVEPFDPAMLPAARQRVRELGPGAALLRCDRRVPARRLWRRAAPAVYSCEPEPVTWVTSAEFGGSP